MSQTVMIQAISKATISVNISHMLKIQYPAGKRFDIAKITPHKVTIKIDGGYATFPKKAFTVVLSNNIQYAEIIRNHDTKNAAMNAMMDTMVLFDENLEEIGRLWYSNKSERDLALTIERTFSRVDHDVFELKQLN